MARRIQTKKLIYIVILLVVIGGLVIFIPRLFATSPTSSASATNSDLKPARASFDANKEFSFPVSKTDKEKQIKMVVEKVELQDEIVVRGQKATAVAGRTFLIVNLKVVNDMDNALTMNTRDYIRLSVNKNDSELLAPDIHNDPVEIQAISTKYTRVGFPVNADDHDFVLQVGEIKGDKQKIELPFNK